MRFCARKTHCTQPAVLAGCILWSCIRPCFIPQSDVSDIHLYTVIYFFLYFCHMNIHMPSSSLQPICSYFFQKTCQNTQNLTEQNSITTLHITACLDVSAKVHLKKTKPTNDKSHGQGSNKSSMYIKNDIYVYVYN